MNVNFDFSGKNFIVVGASSGIGRQVAIELADSGANVLAIARNLERLAKLKENNPARIFTVSLDVTKASIDDWTTALEDFKAACGKIDGGVYCAGILAFTPINSFDTEVARKIFDTDFWGMIDFIRTSSRKKYSNAGASFVLLSSFAAYYGVKSNVAYAADKGAIKSAVVPLAKEIIRNGHRINSVSPALIDTDMTDKVTQAADPTVKEKHLLGVGKPSDVSGMILFLLSDRANWITGQNFMLDGGYLLGAVI